MLASSSGGKPKIWWLARELVGALGGGVAPRLVDGLLSPFAWRGRWKVLEITFSVVFAYVMVWDDREAGLPRPRA